MSSSKNQLLKEIFSKKMALCLSLGFASGMPLFVVLTLLGAYLRKEGVNLKENWFVLSNYDPLYLEICVVSTC